MASTKLSHLPSLLFNVSFNVIQCYSFNVLAIETVAKTVAPFLIREYGRLKMSKCIFCLQFYIVHIFRNHTIEYQKHQYNRTRSERCNYENVFLICSSCKIRLKVDTSHSLRWHTFPMRWHRKRIYKSLQ